jgi:hypothetical protein
VHALIRHRSQQAPGGSTQGDRGGRAREAARSRSARGHHRRAGHCAHRGRHSSPPCDVAVVQQDVEQPRRKTQAGRGINDVCCCRSHRKRCRLGGRRGHGDGILGGRRGRGVYFDLAVAIPRKVVLRHGTLGALHAVGSGAAMAAVGRLAAIWLAGCRHAGGFRWPASDRPRAPLKLDGRFPAAADRSIG